MIHEFPQPRSHLGNATWIEMSTPTHATDYVVLRRQRRLPGLAGTATRSIDHSPTTIAAAAGDLRVVDESGEDYLFPASSFVAINPPERGPLLPAPHDAVLAFLAPATGALTRTE